MIFILNKSSIKLLRFREEFGHCNVPQKDSENPASLGHWCNRMRSMYAQFKKGFYKSSHALSQDRIVRLEEIGFQWEASDYDEAFENRCRQLMEFKSEFGHCNVPQKYEGIKSLGQWCSNMRFAYNRLNKGMKQTNAYLPPERIAAHLTDIGFVWQFSSFHADSFEKRCRELVDFTKEFGHGNVPNGYKANPSFGQWCKVMRASYSKVKKGEKARYNISKDRIERLDKLGFRWQGPCENRLCELMVFKEMFGHNQ
jgi:hypothetical protein